MKQNTRSTLLMKKGADEDSHERWGEWVGLHPVQELRAMESITPADAAHYRKRTLAAMAARDALAEALRLIGERKERSDILVKAMHVLDDYVIDFAMFPPVKKQGPIFT